MKILTATRKVMAMDKSEEQWFRHANPWSVWTRVATFPLIVLAIYSWVWLGWYSLVPISIIAIWTWLNPRVFPKPASTKTWASKVVFGEKVYLDHKQYQVDIPPHHHRAARATTYISLLGAILVVVGAVLPHAWLTVVGAVIAFLGKLWFVDRMVWLFDDIAREDERFAKWLY